MLDKELLILYLWEHLKPNRNEPGYEPEKQVSSVEHTHGQHGKRNDRHDSCSLFRCRLRTTIHRPATRLHLSAGGEAFIVMSGGEFSVCMT